MGKRQINEPEHRLGSSRLSHVAEGSTEIGPVIASSDADYKILRKVKASFLEHRNGHPTLLYRHTFPPYLYHQKSDVRARETTNKKLKVTHEPCPM